jgi:acetyl-CoA carboxylase beta subunit
MDFAFGSMGAVVGEKISRGINHLKTKFHSS